MSSCSWWIYLLGWWVVTIWIYRTLFCGYILVLQRFRAFLLFVGGLGVGTMLRPPHHLVSVHRQLRRRLCLQIVGRRLVVEVLSWFCFVAGCFVPVSSFFAAGCSLCGSPAVWLLVLSVYVRSSSVLFVCVVSRCLLCCGCVFRLCYVNGLESRRFYLSLNPLVVHCSAFWHVLFVFVLMCLCLRCYVLSRV